ncbi:phosphate ABC transporter permease subunit PstC [Anaeromicrobium sp.]|uniref:phosphate ABC transporter permease subunit PstC n=1 Tax=Anaeromicrobium sp. TaxID=1929132 RepID=UPI002ECFF1AC
MVLYKAIDKIFRALIKGITSLVFMILLFIIIFLSKESMVLLKEISIMDFILGHEWNPVGESISLGISPMILGTLYVSFLSIIIGLPVGVGVSIFISIIVKKSTREKIKALIDLMAGIPSVVYGFVGLLWLVKFIEENFKIGSGECILAGGIVLSIMALPYIISTCSETMTKVFEKYSIHSRALGVSKYYMIRNLILPGSKKGILVGTLLGVSRSIGETMAVMMVIGNSPMYPSLLKKGETIPGLIALEMSSATLGSYHYHSLYLAGLVLILILMLINIIFYFIRKFI